MYCIRLISIFIIYVLCSSYTPTGPLSFANLAYKSKLVTHSLTNVCLFGFVFLFFLFQVNNASIPQMDSTTDGVPWRRDESMPDSHSPNTSSTPGESISIRVKFMENERTLSVNRTMKVGDLKRYLQQLDNQIQLAFLSNISTILVKTLGTICVSGEENVIQVDPSLPPPPLNSVGCYKSNTLYIFWICQGPQVW